MNVNPKKYEGKQTNIYDSSRRKIGLQQCKMRLLAEEGKRQNNTKLIENKTRRRRKNQKTKV